MFPFLCTHLHAARARVREYKEGRHFITTTDRGFRFEAWWKAFQVPVGLGEVQCLPCVFNMVAEVFPRIHHALFPIFCCTLTWNLMEAGKNRCWHMLHVTALRCIEPDKISCCQIDFSYSPAGSVRALCPSQPRRVPSSNDAAVWKSLRASRTQDREDSPKRNIPQDCRLLAGEAFAFEKRGYT